MSKQPPNAAIPQRGPTLHQGMHPTPDPVKGDIWIDNFDTAHVWQGYYWVKVQGPTIVPPEESIPVLLGQYEKHKVYYGPTPPPHGEGTYWITNHRELYEAEVFESIAKKINTTNFGVLPTTSHTWEKVRATHVVSAVRGFVAAEALLQIPSLETEDQQQQCDEQEAAEKFKAFENTADPTGRLVKRLERIKQLQEEAEKREAEFKAKWIQNHIKP